jgi:hypothetical protein
MLGRSVAICCSISASRSKKSCAAGDPVHLLQKLAHRETGKDLAAACVVVLRGRHRGPLEVLFGGIVQNFNAALFADT